MGDEPTQDGKRFDSMEPWRGMRDVYMDAWAKTMVDMVNTEAYAQASGAMLKTLEHLAMPSRADFISIAERMTNIEMKLDDLDAKLDAMYALLAKPGSAPRTEARQVPQPAKKKAKAKPTKRGKK